jgi:two-component system chemotaxis response regulator CheY
MPISVLICDDLASVQSMLRRMLERGGLVVSGVASTADEVLARYREQRPDVVLLDYRMPGAEGLSLLRELLAHDPGARVVMCSGTGDPDVQRAALQAGAMEWVLKPIYPQTFITIIHDLIARGPRAATAPASTD